MKLKNPRNHRTSTAKAFNLAQFNERFYNNEDACKEVFINLKYPNGYSCEECGHTHFSWVKGRKASQWKHCCKQTYVLAGTMFQDAKLS